MVILQFKFFVVTVKYLCNGRRRITIAYFLVLVLPKLCFVFAMQLQCFVFISNVLQSKFTQHSNKFPQTLGMHGSAVLQPCNCKVSKFPWKLATARVSMTDLTYSHKGNKTHIHTLSVVIQSSMQHQQKETGTNIHNFNKAPVYFLLSWRPQQNFILPNVSKARYKMIGNAHSH